MSQIVSYNSFDYKPIHTVPVIVSFDSQGHIAPLWVRINGQPYKVESSELLIALETSLTLNVKSLMVNS